MPKAIHPRHTRSWVRDLVRSGMVEPTELVDEVVDAVRADHPELDDPVATARGWVADAEHDWRAEADTWPAGPTDHDRLQSVFADLESAGLVVLQGCADHWAARDAAGGAARGVVWFTPSDVWHAIDDGMLEVNLWHPSTANAAPGEPLLAEVLAAFRVAGLAAEFDEGRIEVRAFWRRRPDSV